MQNETVSEIEFRYVKNEIDSSIDDIEKELLNEAKSLYNKKVTVNSQMYENINKLLTNCTTQGLDFLEVDLNSKLRSNEVFKKGGDMVLLAATIIASMISKEELPKGAIVGSILIVVYCIIIIKYKKKMEIISYVLSSIEKYKKNNNIA